jgi:hypothetical protein
MKVMNSIEYSEKMSKSLSGEKNPMFRKTIYDIWNIKYGKEIADKKLEEWRKNQKMKCSRKHVWIFNESINKRKFIKETELQKYLEYGWRRGQK